MSARHGVFTSEVATSLTATNTATSGIPFVIGIAPLSKADADTRATAGTPVLATSFAEAEAKLGYDENWVDYGISEFMYYHFKLAACQPVIFLPLPETFATQSFSGDGSEKEFTVTAKPDTVQTVKVGDVAVAVSSYDRSTGKVTLVQAPATGTDNVEVTYLTKPTDAQVAASVENIDLCMTMFGIVPDMIAAPGFSHSSAVSAAMAAKAGAINGMFKGKALVDIQASSYTAAVAAKNGGSYTEEMIVCWPMGRAGSLVFHGSTIEAGRIAQTDTSNSGVPYESPSNKPVLIDSLCDENGTAILLTLAQANILNDAGINTFLNFMGAWKAWGNYTGCFPADTDVKNYFTPISRMFDWVANTLIKTFWSKVDNPMNRRLIDTVVDSANIWLNGLVGRGCLLGGRVAMLADENPLTDLVAGIMRIHVYMTPPSPAQEIDFTLEYDASYVESALS